jgi:hypothetical protein
MKIIVVIIALLFIAALMWAIIKARRHTESKITIDEHPATFKKPDIEMVNKRPPDTGNTSTNLKIADDDTDA